MSEMLAWMTIILSVYIFVESTFALANMSGGLSNFMCKIKYALALTSSLAFGYYAAIGESLWLAFGSAGTLSWFILPRSIYRIRQYFDELKFLEL